MLIYTRAQIEEAWKPDYKFIWHYSNKAVLLLGKTELYAFFLKEGKFGKEVYRFITIDIDFERGRLEAEKAWNPPKPEYVHPRFGKNYKNLVAIQHIEDMISSLTKKDPIGTKVRKSDCAFIYYDGKQWKAFYPSIDLLIGHHMRWNISDPGSVHSCNYCAYLKSQAHKNQRNEWNQIPTITAGE